MSATPRRGPGLRPGLGRLAALPRDKADTLLLLTAALMVLAPHFAHLPLWGMPGDAHAGRNAQGRHDIAISVRGQHAQFGRGAQPARQRRHHAGVLERLLRRQQHQQGGAHEPVSYTHLTLPTKA